MAAARAHLADGMEGSGGEEAPRPFRQAVAALAEVRPRPEVRLGPLPAPRRLAPFAYALEAAVEVDGEELADGRFVLLHDPAGQEAWQGTFRVVTLARAELEPEIAADPLLPEVTWAWLTGALQARRAAYAEPGGTVTRASSHSFGELAGQAPHSEIEIRASWTPREARDPGSPRAPRELGELPGNTAGGHLYAWCDLLSQCAGLPPEDGTGAAVVPLPQRRGPQPL
ncbi:DUF3000 domain-containing protein [Streptomyces carminius]|uniref:DUF3000 domain-containing protein n=1 Tax=Streptomyces carminius TaxID=2665496 RepID=A0A2M8LPQ0_9ACTN|nr:DUF3000 domain-containing protein [Streptomyces carminius]PJE93944.1 DUF3000 domain-containing protein [Streptomyces carminius]